MTDRYVELITSADELQATGRLDEARTFAEQALAERPTGVSAREMLGILDAKQGRFLAATRWLVEANALDPTSFQCALWLSLAFRSINENEKALDAAKQAIERDPLQGTGYNQLGLSCMRLGMFRDAETAFRKALEFDPKSCSLRENLGHSLYGLGRREEANEAFALAVELDSSGINVSIRLGNLAFAHLEFELVRKLALSAITKNPYSVPARLLLIRSLLGLGQSEEAEHQVSKAIRLIGENPELRNAFASVREAQGRNDEAREQLEMSLNLNPRQGFAYYGLVRSRQITTRDNELIAKIERTLADPCTPPEHQTYLHYSLGKAFEDLAYYQTAMEQYNSANKRAAEVAGQLFHWSEEGSHNQALKVFESFNESFFEAAVHIGSQDDLPIFVVGMMRSGTTLVEQILSCHPEIGAGGEQPFWLHNGVNTLQPKALMDLGAQYSELLRRVCPGKKRVVDKMPNNYRLLGVIRTAFPKAKIIHIKRHPVDTCISLWSTPKACPPEWGGEKAAIVAEYRLYQDYMAHWRRVIFPEHLFELDYESLISNQEETTRRMMAFCGVDWNDACLKPEKNRRIVNTPSMMQVRRPVYKGSVARWKKFERWLGEFAALLSGAKP